MPRPMMMFTNATLRRCPPVLVLLTLAGANAVLAQPAKQALPPRALATIQYRVSFPAPQTHYLEVEATVPTDRKPEIELTMPVWTPGSYLVREYARNVEDVAAHAAGAAGAGAAAGGGPALAIDKTRKNHWR